MAARYSVNQLFLLNLRIINNEFYNDMKTKLFFLLGAVTALILNLASCKSGAADNAAADAVDTLTVDRFFAEADTLAGDTIVVEGLCTHLCRHGGKKAFLEGADTTLVLRCEATAEAGGAFSPDCVGKTLVIKGVVAENRIDEAAVVEMERKYAENNEGHNCATDAKAQGQDTIDSFAARMADYRSRIAKNAEATGKAYISFYYLDAVSYDIK